MVNRVCISFKLHYVAFSNTKLTIEFNLEFYTQVDDLDYLLQALSLDASIPSKFQSLTSSLTSLIQDFGLLGFQTLCIDDPKSVLSIARLVDKANGYALGGLTPGNESLFETVMSLQSGEQDIREVQEKYWDEDESQFEENELLNEEL